MHLLRIVQLLALGILLASCTVGTRGFAKVLSQKTAKRASLDLQCPSSRIQITEIDLKSYVAAGCGRQAIYVAGGQYCGHNLMTEEDVDNWCTMILNADLGQDQPAGK
jgi:hypothetical protein